LDQIEFAGPVYPPELFTRLSGATLFCLPSDHENFGLAAAEAMAAGAPTLLSSEVALAVEAVAAGAAALVPRDPRGLASALDDWLNRPDDRLELGESGQAFARRSLSHGAVGSAWLDFYGALAHAG